MKFRVKHVEAIGFYPQVKLNFLSSWETVRAVLGKYESTSENNLGDPLATEEEAIAICRGYKEQLDQDNQKPKVTYREIHLDS